MAEQESKQELIPQNQNVDGKVKKPKKLWRWCCGIPALICVLVFVALIISAFVIEKKQSDKIAGRNKPETYSEIFNTNLSPDYSVTASDEEKFNQKMIEFLQKYDSGTSNFSENEGTKTLRSLSAEEAIEEAKSDMTFLKDNYPEGYYLVVNSVLKTAEKDQLFPNLYLRSVEEASRIDFLVHELSHAGWFAHMEITSSGYVIEDKFIVSNSRSVLIQGAELQKFLNDPSSINMPQGDELLKYIGEAATTDDKYLKEDKQDIYTTLDEVISYTKSLRVARAYNYHKKSGIDESRLQILSRQLYFLSLHLKNIKENHPDDWQKLKKDKVFAYIMARQISIAKTEIQVAKDEGASSSSGDNFASTTDKNLALMDENQALFDELYTAAGISSMGDLKNLTQQNLTTLGLKIEKF